MKISIPYYIKQTSDYIDLYDVRLPDMQTYAGWSKSEFSDSPMTLESIKTEHARRLAAGAFDKNISLADRWAKPDLNISDEELATTLSEISGEWEQDLDDFFGED